MAKVMHWTDLSNIEELKLQSIHVSTSIATAPPRLCGPQPGGFSPDIRESGADGPAVAVAELVL